MDNGIKIKGLVQSEHPEEIPKAICEQNIVIVDIRGNLATAKSIKDSGVQAIDSDGNTINLTFKEIESSIIFRRE